jgi:hypothetical protein
MQRQEKDAAQAKQGNCFTLVIDFMSSLKKH